MDLSVVLVSGRMFCSSAERREKDKARSDGDDAEWRADAVLLFVSCLGRRRAEWRALWASRWLRRLRSVAAEEMGMARNAIVPGHKRCGEREVT